METNNIGYVVIKSEEYKEMIENLKDYETYTDLLKEKNSTIDNILKIFEKSFFENLLNKEEYHFKNMKECNLNDYHFQELSKCFFDIGIYDIQYINTSILNIKNSYDENKNLSDT